MRTNWQNTGKAFERIVEATATHYASKRIMRLRKVDPPLRYVGNMVVHQPNPFADYVGVWTEQGGQAVFLEAKSTSKPKLESLTDKQIEALRQWHVAGAVSFLLWEFAGDAALWTVPMLLEQRKEWRHFKFERGLPVPKGEGWIVHDFRVTMHALWGKPQLATQDPTVQALIKAESN